MHAMQSVEYNNKVLSTSRAYIMHEKNDERSMYSRNDLVLEVLYLNFLNKWERNNF